LKSMQVANEFLATKWRRAFPPLRRPAWSATSSRRKMSTQVGNISAETLATTAPLLLSDDELASILLMTTDWMRTHAEEIPGFKRLGSYFRFCREVVKKWPGSLEPLLDAESAAKLMDVPKSWVYANADQVGGTRRGGDGNRRSRFH
jgi:hypothetical protein